jgi:hypothetical protein
MSLPGLSWSGHLITSFSLIDFVITMRFELPTLLHWRLSFLQKLLTALAICPSKANSTV